MNYYLTSDEQGSRESLVAELSARYYESHEKF